jgi:hypothetical protein
MEQTPPTTQEIASQIVDWSIARIIGGMLDKGDASAIAQEFDEWIDPKSKELRILSFDTNHNPLVSVSKAHQDQ